MQAPKRKTSKSKRNMRRAHHSLAPSHAPTCPNCGETVRPHSICLNCGQYRGKQYLGAQGEAEA
ncbi:MAG: 50S ribosomal protein L32 [bacterium]|nr:50S ribosomal protein L32 [bacterium]